MQSCDGQLVIINIWNLIPFIHKQRIHLRLFKNDNALV